MYDQLLKDPSLPVSNPTVSHWQLPVNESLNGIRSDELPSHRDIVIIGSGITACSVSRELLTNGFVGTITLLEAREVCSGATGRNGGRINCVAVHDYEKFRRKFGDEAAKNIVRFEMAHYDEIHAAASALGPEGLARTEVRNVETVAAVFSEEKLAELKQMLANFEAAFPEYAGRWKIAEGDEMQKEYHMALAKGALIGRAGVAWPYRLVTNLFASLLKQFGNRFQIETHTPVLAVKRELTGNSPHEVLTSRGSIRANHVIYCTEGHTAHLVPGLRGILVPRRGQMTVQSPGSNFGDYQGQRSWSFYLDHCFDYLCQNANTKEIFIGGGDISGFDNGLAVFGITSDAAESVAAKSHLRGVLPVIFADKWGSPQPGKSALFRSWSGIMCNSLDGVPMVGRLPSNALDDREGGESKSGAEWISAGYGGYGMVNAWRCGRAVAQQVLGQAAPAWLPKEYRITSDRVLKLRTYLSEVANSEEHLRALL